MGYKFDCESSFIVIFLGNKLKMEIIEAVHSAVASHYFSGNLHWEDLDADIELDSLENPEDYPLVYR